MPRTTSQAIRQTFLDFFASKHAHTIVPSSPCVPHDDPTLLFANAGMNQFKPIFLGQVAPGSPLERLARAVDTQKCIRAGGKHNDLEDVGKDTSHHTFFEMLGNWSFGDYFKAEAIEWAWELLTEIYSLPGEQMYATYFGGDEAQGLEPDLEARDLWLRHLPAERVLPGTMKDNFWEMGETGPCGPCSELHFDRVGERNAAALVNADDPDVIEIWNLVFIQFDRLDASTLRPLPAKHVDTGMGLERLTSLIQGVQSNYDTDLFTPIFASIERITGAPRPYMGKLGKADRRNIDMAYRVIADHIRTLVFAITDGAMPSNEGRGYVLRRILRRAVRFGHQMLGAKAGFMSQLVPTVVETMGDAFPELRKNPQHVIDIILEEEESFGRTLDRGIKRFQKSANTAGRTAITKSAAEHTGDGGSADTYVLDYLSKHNLIDMLPGLKFYGPDKVDWRKYKGRFHPIITGPDAFALYDTYGFPLDLTILMAQERGLTVDVEGFNRCMEEQKQRSRAGAPGGGAHADNGMILDGEAIANLQSLRVKPTNDHKKFDAHDKLASIKAIWNGRNFDEHINALSSATKQVCLILDKTNFYATMGGQVCDQGIISLSRDTSTSGSGSNHGSEFRVEEVRSFGGYVLHIGHLVRGEMRVRDDVQLHVDTKRRSQVASNHTATHLLNLGLRRVLGDRVDQKGSLVDADRLRFDFSHTKPVSADQLGLVEQIVSEQIEKNLTVYAQDTPQYVARGIAGLRAVFGEAYPDPVRVVSIGMLIPELLDNPENPAWRDYSIEFCGGTHVHATGAIKDFALISETGIAKGIRRVEALTGVPAQAAHAGAEEAAKRLARASDMPITDLPAEVAALAAEFEGLALPALQRAQLQHTLAQLQNRCKQAAKEIAKAKAAHAQLLAEQLASSHQSAGEQVLVAQLDVGSDRGAMQAALKTITQLCPRSAVMLASVDEQSTKPAVALIAAVPVELTKKGFKAGNWVQETAQILGGKGGGRPEQAQGGGPQIDKLGEALKAARTLASAAIVG